MYLTLGAGCGARDSPSSERSVPVTWPKRSNFGQSQPVPQPASMMSRSLRQRPSSQPQTTSVCRCETSWKGCSRVDAFHWFQKLRCETIESRLVIGVGLPKRVKRDGHAVIRVPAVRISLEDQSAEGGQSTRIRQIARTARGQAMTVFLG